MNYPPLTKCGKQNISINMGRYLGRLKYSQTIQSQRTTRGHTEPLRQLLPHPSADYDSPPKIGEDLPQHWPTGIEINEVWDTPQAFERIVKYHSIPALTKYIRSCSLQSAPDIDGWRMKNLLQRIFLSSDPR